MELWRRPDVESPAKQHMLRRAHRRLPNRPHYALAGAIPVRRKFPRARAAETSFDALYGLVARCFFFRRMDF